MPIDKIGVRELKANLSACLRRIKSGQTLVITQRGRPIGQLSPVQPTLEEALQEASATGSGRGTAGSGGRPGRR